MSGWDQVALWAVVALPAVAGVSLLMLGRAASRLAVPSALVVAAAELVLAVMVALSRPTVSMQFLPGGPLRLRVDGLSGLVAPTVAAVALLALVASVAEPRLARARFFGLMLVFTAAVELTVTAATLPSLLAGWEVMGATSYALIAYRWDVDEHVDSGGVAFVTPRAGDVGLYLAAGAALAGSTRGAGGTWSLIGLAELSGGWLHVAAAGVLLAAFGKAAQLPFSFWLSRAMVGPSPVSALLHSAAMVAMGGYLLLRMQPLLASAGWAAGVAAWGGVLTALLLGVVALAQTDLKQLLAASTSAQLGFVVLGAGAVAGEGAGGVPAGGVAHLVGHAATKALLFLAAGAWLSALGTKQLGGLRGAGRMFPAVGATAAVGALALGGVPPFALWATKDEVLAAARAQSAGLYVIALAAAVVSAAYAGKVVGVILGAPTPAAEEQIAEQVGARQVSWFEKGPLLVLAAGAALLGILALPPVGDVVRRALGAQSQASATPIELLVSGVLGVGVLFGAAWWPHRLPAPRWAAAWLGLERAADGLVRRPTARLARTLARFDDRVLDAGTVWLAVLTVRLAERAGRFDDVRIDGLVRRATAAARALGVMARRPQTGQLHQYYAQAVVGLGAVVLFLLVVR